MFGSGGHRDCRVYLQVAQQSAPGLCVALGNSLAALVHRAPAPCLPRAAQLAGSLQAEAASADGDRLGSVSSGQVGEISEGYHPLAPRGSAVPRHLERAQSPWRQRGDSLASTLRCISNWGGGAQS